MIFGDAELIVGYVGEAAVGFLDVPVDAPVYEGVGDIIGALVGWAPIVPFVFTDHCKLGWIGILR
jgi:hypothetical protein